MPEKPVVLVGLGFTASRLARRLLREGREVYAATRNPGRFSALTAEGLKTAEFTANSFPREAAVAHTIPPLADAEEDVLRHFLLAIRPARIVYVSATSVYGELAVVDADSPVLPSSAPGYRRLAAEQWIQAGDWSSLILRAAAIYGPGRGAHRRVLDPDTPADSQRRGPSGVVSRIHVDDLASLVKAGLECELTGAFPVADDLPCSTHDVMRWSADFLGVDPDSLDLSGPVTTGRSVDGQMVRKKLGVKLQYPDFRRGIAQCLREEGEGS
jgi:nucleoside-diphosphate-sugar epimerase